MTFNFKCSYCNDSLSDNLVLAYGHYFKCEKCNVLYYVNSHKNLSYLSKYILSSKCTIKIDKQTITDSLHSFMLNKDNFLPKYFISKPLYDDKLYKLGLYEVVPNRKKDNGNYLHIFDEKITLNDSILNSISPQNIDDKLKTILTFM